MKKTIFSALFCLLLLCACGREEKAPLPPPTIPMLTEAPPTEAEKAVSPKKEPAEAAETTETTVAAEATAVPEETSPASEPTASEEKKAASVSGVIANTETVNVRQGPSIHTKALKKLHRNDPVSVTEKVVVDSVGWGHIEDGWVCMDYLKLDGAVPERPGTLGVVYHTDTVNIRSDPSLQGEVTGKYQRNEIITVLETQGKWVRTDQGWVSLDYVQLQDHRSTQQQSATGGDYDREDALPGDNDYPAPSEGVYPGNGSYEGPESLHPQQHTCSHPDWKLWKHIDDVAIEHKLYICQCGQEEASLEGWKYHAALQKEDPENHSSYSVKDLGTTVIPGGDYWECVECGVVERMPIGQKP